MNKLLLFIILLQFLFPNISLSEDYITTALLPKDEPIMPLPKPDVSKNIIILNTEFIKSEPILSVTKGNWKYITYYIQYKVLNEVEKYPYKELTFICKDLWAAEGTGILIKKINFPFKEGKKSFYLEKDNLCVYKSYFKIISYSH